MLIESYRFGKIIVGGKEYTSDLIIHSEAILSDWWRAEGHRITLEDLDWVLPRKPEVLIVGKGRFGRMKLDDKLAGRLQLQGIRLEAADTREAVVRYNDFVRSACNVAGAFHLTC